MILDLSSAGVFPELEVSVRMLPDEARRAVDDSQSPEVRARRNRLVLEAAFPDALRKVYGDGWRPVLLGT